ncbi:MAG: molybdate ABC transporter permease subunit [Shimia sp.]
MDPFGPGEWAAIWLSLRVAFWSTLLSMPLAGAVAWLLARRRFPGHGVLNALVHLPLVLPPVVTGYLLLVLFGRQGPFGALGLAFTPAGAMLAAAIMAFPLMVRALRLAIEAVDPGLEEAARTLGASRVGVARRVTLPLMAPGIAAAAILGAAKAMGEFGATITFVANIPGLTQTIPSAIFGLLQVPGQDGAVLRLVAVSVVLSVGALLASEALARRAARR